MAYALAPSLVQYRAEINRLWPQRDKASDGWIGDAAHASRPSDHNPGARGLVHAFDTDEDLDGYRANTGPDATPLVNALISVERARVAAGRPPRVKYVIYEGHILAGVHGPAPWQWRPYAGSNAHRLHVHLSILSTVEAEQDTSPWLTTGGDQPPPEPARNPLEEDDMPYILAGSAIGNYYVDASGASPIYTQGFIDTLVAQKVPVVNISAASPEEQKLTVAQRNAGTDEEIAAHANETRLRVARVQQLAEADAAEPPAG